VGGEKDQQYGGGPDGEIPVAEQKRIALGPEKREGKRLRIPTQIADISGAKYHRRPKTRAKKKKGSVF